MGPQSTEVSDGVFEDAPSTSSLPGSRGGEKAALEIFFLSEAISKLDTHVRDASKNPEQSTTMLLKDMLTISGLCAWHSRKLTHILRLVQANRCRIDIMQQLKEPLAEFFNRDFDGGFLVALEDYKFYDEIKLQGNDDHQVPILCIDPSSLFRDQCLASSQTGPDSAGHSGRIYLEASGVVDMSFSLNDTLGEEIYRWDELAYSEILPQFDLPTKRKPPKTSERFKLRKISSARRRSKTKYKPAQVSQSSEPPAVEALHHILHLLGEWRYQIDSLHQKKGCFRTAMSKITALVRNYKMPNSAGKQSEMQLGATPAMFHRLIRRMQYFVISVERKLNGTGEAVEFTSAQQLSALVILLDDIALHVKAAPTQTRPNHLILDTIREQDPTLYQKAEALQARVEEWARNEMECCRVRENAIRQVRESFRLLQEDAPEAESEEH